MKKIIYLLGYLLIFNILICLSLILDIYSNKNNITQTSLEIYISNNDNYNLIEQILKDSNKKDLIKFIDYIDLDINHTIENDNNNYTAFTITLPQDKSFIAIYKKNYNNTYTFLNLIDNLHHIDNFYFYNNFFIVEQTIKNSTDSENNRSFVEIFFKHENIYTSVFKRNIYIESNDSYKNDSKIIVSSSIDFLDSDITKIVYVSIYKSSNDSNVINNESEIIVKEIYEWNPNLNIFEIISKEIINNK